MTAQSGAVKTAINLSEAEGEMDQWIRQMLNAVPIFLRQFFFGPGPNFYRSRLKARRQRRNSNGRFFLNDNFRSWRMLRSFPLNRSELDQKSFKQCEKLVLPRTKTGRL